MSGRIQTPIALDSNPQYFGLNILSSVLALASSSPTTFSSYQSDSKHIGEILSLPTSGMTSTLWETGPSAGVNLFPLSTTFSQQEQQAQQKYYPPITATPFESTSFTNFPSQPLFVNSKNHPLIRTPFSIPSFSPKTQTSLSSASSSSPAPSLLPTLTNPLPKWNLAGSASQSSDVTQSTSSKHYQMHHTKRRWQVYQPPEEQSPTRHSLKNDSKEGHQSNGEQKRTRRSKWLRIDTLDPEVSVPGERKHRRLTEEQLRILLDIFAQNPRPNTQDRYVLSQRLNVSPQSVRFWFQNRRQAAKTRLRSTLCISCKKVTSLEPTDSKSSATITDNASFDSPCHHFPTVCHDLKKTFESPVMSLESCTSEEDDLNCEITSSSFDSPITSQNQSPNDHRSSSTSSPNWTFKIESSQTSEWCPLQYRTKNTSNENNNSDKHIDEKTKEDKTKTEHAKLIIVDTSAPKNIAVTATHHFRPW